MSTFLDLHVLQAVPYSNLNRDDLGSPKTATYGGVVRARISSQATKRATRLWMEDQGASRSFRTRLLPDLVRIELENRGWGRDDVAPAVAVAMAIKPGMQLTFRGDRVVGDQLTFLPGSAVGPIADVIAEYREDLAAAAEAGKFDGDAPKTDKAKLAKAAEKVSADMVNAIETTVSSQMAQANEVIALMGRFLADDEDAIVDAAVQVAHSLTTHAAAINDDFFTAVDDLHTDDSGAGHVNTAQYTSGVHYRYATVDLDMLRGHLAQQGSDLSAAKVLDLFVRAFLLAEPSGKQNAAASHTRPGFVSLTVRTDRPVNHVAAFEHPVQSVSGFLRPSIMAIDAHVASADAMYGTAGIAFVGHATTEDVEVGAFGERLTVDQLVADSTNAAVSSGGACP